MILLIRRVLLKTQIHFLTLENWDLVFLVSRFNEYFAFFNSLKLHNQCGTHRLIEKAITNSILTERWFWKEIENYKRHRRLYIYSWAFKIPLPSRKKKKILRPAEYYSARNEKCH